MKLGDFLALCKHKDNSRCLIVENTKGNIICKMRIGYALAEEYLMSRELVSFEFYGLEICVVLKDISRTEYIRNTCAV